MKILALILFCALSVAAQDDGGSGSGDDSSSLAPSQITTSSTTSSSTSESAASSSSLFVSSSIEETSSVAATSSSMQFSTSPRPITSTPLPSATSIAGLTSVSPSFSLSISAEISSPSSTPLPSSTTAIDPPSTTPKPSTTVSSVEILVSSSTVLANPPSPSPGPPVPIAAIAGAIGGVIVAIIICVILVCVVVILKKKRGTYTFSKGRTYGSLADGSTLAREYELCPVDNQVDAPDPFEQDETTDTFGIKSPAPVEVSIGGQKFTFPDLPDGGDENLPQLIFVNPVKPNENSSFARCSSTLPSRSKNKTKASDRASIIDPDVFISDIKTSKSTSEINKEASSDQPPNANESEKQRKESTIYDIPRLSDPKAKESSTVKSPEYVKLEPCSKVQDTIKTVPNELVSSPVLKSDAIESVVQPVTDSKSNSEGIYDNPRLIKSKPLAALQETISLTPAKTDGHSIYDVPRKALLAETEMQTTLTKEEIEPPKQEKMESLYDVPKKAFAADQTHISSSQLTAENSVETGQHYAAPTTKKDSSFIAELKKRSKSSLKSVEEKATKKENSLVSEPETGSEKPVALPKPKVVPKPTILAKPENKQKDSPPRDVSTVHENNKVKAPDVSTQKAVPSVVGIDQKLSDSTAKLDPSKYPPLIENNATSTEKEAGKPTTLPKPNVAETATASKPKQLKVGGDTSTETDTPSSPTKPSVPEKPTTSRLSETGDKCADKAEASKSPPPIAQKPATKPKPLEIGDTGTENEASKPYPSKPTVARKPTIKPGSSDTSSASTNEDGEKPSTASKSSTPSVAQKPAKPKPVEVTDASSTATSKDSDKPSTPSKPSVAKKPVISAKPRRSESPAAKAAGNAEKNDRADSEGVEETKSSPECSDPIDQPSVKPKPKKRSLIKPGMPKNVVQELFARQKSKPTVDTPSKPAVKPKPNFT